jgi:hypothetical protein
MAWACYTIIPIVESVHETGSLAGWQCVGTDNQVADHGVRGVDRRLNCRRVGPVENIEFQDFLDFLDYTTGSQLSRSFWTGDIICPTSRLVI